MDDRTEIIERLEKLTGPDREVDAEIMFDLFAKPVGQHALDGGPVGYLWPDNDPAWSFGCRFPGQPREWFFAQPTPVIGERLLIERDGAWVQMNSLRVPALTDSIDAAVALVEKVKPGWNWSLISGRRQRGHEGVVIRPTPHTVWTSTGDDGKTKGATPAIALLIALLRSDKEAG